MPTRPSAKLFRVLVAGGLAMASPACSSDPASPALDAGGSAQDGAGGPADAGALLDAMAAADACLNTPGDCNHGMCSW